MANKASTAPGQELGRKLSAADMGYDKEAILKLVLGDTNSDHFLYRVLGTATGLKPYKIKEGERAGEVSFGLQGQFEATNADGEVKAGIVLYLPGYANDMVVAALSMPEASGVRIAFDVYTRYEKSAATSYVFTVRDLLNEGAQGVDEVKAMTASLPMPAKVLALPKE